MALVLTEPFNNLTAWTNLASATIVAGGRTGTAAQIAASGNLIYGVPAPNQTDSQTFGFAFQVSSLAADRNIVANRSLTPSSVQQTIVVRTDGSIRVSNPADSGTYATAAGLIAVNTWHYLECSCKLADAPNGSISVRLDGTTVITATGIDTFSGTGTPKFDQLRLTVGAAGYTVLYDDLYLRDDLTFQGDPSPPAAGHAFVVFTAAAPAGVQTTPASGSASFGFAAFAIGTQVAGHAVGVMEIMCNTAPLGGCRWFGMRLSVEVSQPFPVPTASLWGTPAVPHARWDVEPYRWGGFDSWVDISPRVRGLNTVRGRTDPSNPAIPVGSMTVELDNTDGYLSPWATAGPFVADGVSMIRPGIVVRAGVVLDDGTWCPLFTGTAEQLPEDVAYDRHTTWTVTDTWTDLAAWALPTISAGTGNGETTTARINRLLDDCRWRFGRALDPSPVTVLGHDPELDDNRAAEIYRVGQSDGGFVYIDNRGNLAFLNRLRVTTPPAAPLITVADCNDGTRLPYASITPGSDNLRILNSASGQRLGGTVQISTDSGSASRFGSRSAGMGFPRDDLICDTDAQVKVICDDAIKLFAWDDLRVDAVELDAGMDLRLPPIMAGFKLFDGLRVMRDLAAGDLDRNLRIDGIEHRITPYEFTTVLHTEGVGGRAPTGWGRDTWAPTAIGARTEGKWAA